MGLSHSYTSTFSNSRNFFSDFFLKTFSVALVWIGSPSMFDLSVVSESLNALFMDCQIQCFLWLSNPIPLTCLQVLILLFSWAFLFESYPTDFSLTHWIFHSYISYLFNTILFTKLPSLFHSNFHGFVVLIWMFTHNYHFASCMSYMPYWSSMSCV